MPSQDLPAIALVADDVSLRMGPDSARALHYFRGLRARGLDVHIVTRERHRGELCDLLAGEEQRLQLVPDSRQARWLTRLALLLPERAQRSCDALVGCVRQRALRRAASQLVRARGVRIVHQVTPTRPGAVSRIHGLGVSVVMGPLREPTELPPGFREQPGLARRIWRATAGLGGLLAQALLPGRRRAQVLLVSDARSSRAVPAGSRGRKLRLAADALQLEEWKAPERGGEAEVPEFVFAGPLGPDCGVDHLLDAFRLTLDAQPARLRIIGDGPLRARLEQRSEELDLGNHLQWCSWLDARARRTVLERCDVFVHPGLRGEGAGVLMEAMALGLPVVATDWGPASDIASDGAGLLVGPRTSKQFCHELASTMHRLAESPALRRELGERASIHAREAFDWSHRIERLLDVYRLAASRRP